MTDEEFQRETALLTAACDDAFVLMAKIAGVIVLLGVAAIGGIVLWL